MAIDRYYFDNNATTPVADEVFAAIQAPLRESFGNASSIHTFGQDAKMLVEQSRRQVAELLNANPRGIVFTSGGTEADNLAVLGAVRAHPGERKHVITSSIEHPAVLAACEQLETEGVDVTYLAVGGDGVVSPGEVRQALRPETVLITVMHANNELGTIQPLVEIGRIAREAGVLFHSDGVQAAGKLPIDVKALGVDLYSISAHKIYGPKGVGVLYARRGLDLKPTTYGGHQERDRRRGTENVPGIVGLGAAAELVGRELGNSEEIGALRDRLEQGILDSLEGVGINGAGAPRVPNTTNIYFDGVDGEPLLIALDLKGFAVSSGAACSSGAAKPSHVLLAIGLSKDRAKSSLRLSLGRQNTSEQVELLLEAIPEVVQRLRTLSPAYAG